MPAADHERWMRRALEVAAATPDDDVPVGALIVDARGTVLAEATNRREQCGDPTAHAEILALRAAAARHGDGWRLGGCTLVVTLEPCTMCAGAAVMSRISGIVFGAYEPRTGAVSSLWDVVRDRRLTHRPEVAGGVLERECSDSVTAFFHRARDVSPRREPGYLL
ncbi:nucleoside deaminase [Rhodococcoides corynebacterioides]|uniref:nucleoside deaminase n=1 Tax=Rhodococcoides corynebacterioides TaxID=53972 RepID=UPI0021BE27E8|nr:nucleoside deaminase [Rhodococcus corynebacterioides]